VKRNLLPLSATATIDGLASDIELEFGCKPEGAATATSRVEKTNYSRMYYSAAEQLCTMPAAASQ